MKEAENEHFGVTKRLPSFGFCSQTKYCGVPEGEQASRKYPSSSFSFHLSNEIKDGTQFSSVCATGPSAYLIQIDCEDEG